MSPKLWNDAERKYRILLVDDHPIVREGISLFLNLQSNLEVCSTAENIHEAIHAANASEHDLAIIDLSLKEESGLVLVRTLKANHPDMRILVLSMYDESLAALRALQSGANGYLMKQEGTEHILTAIYDILAGNCHISPSVQAQIAQQLFSKRSGNLASLSDREFTVLQLIGTGLGTREIATRLNRSIKTIEAHRANIKDKLGLKNAQELVRYAIQMLDVS